MLFDPAPKKSKKDFYDLEDVLSAFQRSVSKSKLIVVKGGSKSGSKRDKACPRSAWSCSSQIP